MTGAKIPPPPSLPPDNQGVGAGVNRSKPNESPGEKARGYGAEGIYDDHDQTVVRAIDDVRKEMDGDYMENTAFRHGIGSGPGIGPTEGPVTKARRAVNFGTSTAQKLASGEKGAIGADE